MLKCHVSLQIIGHCISTWLILLRQSIVLKPVLEPSFHERSQEVLLISIIVLLNIILFSFFIFLILSNLLNQNVKTPKNIRQAVQYTYRQFKAIAVQYTYKQYKSSCTAHKQTIQGKLYSTHTDNIRQAVQYTYRQYKASCTVHIQTI